MKKILLLVFVLLGLLGACTTQVETQENANTQTAKDYVQAELEKAKENQEEETIKPPVIVKPEVQDEEPEEEVEEEPVQEIDIIVESIEIDGESSYDLNDDDEDIEVTVNIKTIGLEKGDSFVVVVKALRKGDVIDTCTYLHVVESEFDNECELSDFERYGDHDIEVYADENEKFVEQEVTLRNNLLVEEFELEA